MAFIHRFIQKILTHYRVIIFIFALYLVSSIYIPVLIEEFRFQAHLTRSRFQAVFPNGFIGIISPNFSTPTIPGWAGDYSLFIPKLGLQENVVKDTNANIKDLYQLALKSGVAHAAGSVYPGSRGVSYYFAHSSGLPFWGTRTATFATLYRLELDDEVILYYLGKTYIYKVIEKKIVDPSDTAFLMDNSTDTQTVVLQTCWPLGTDWRRLLIVAKMQK